MGQDGLRRIDVEKSAYHHQSQNDIGVIIPVRDSYLDHVVLTPKRRYSGRERQRQWQPVPHL